MDESYWPALAWMIILLGARAYIPSVKEWSEVNPVLFTVGLWIGGSSALALISSLASLELGGSKGTKKPTNK